ncbi:MAG TPA: RluA family pseudouridine synthase [Verrucomicrobiae bacterium]|nr:RluA family pseudouridine synthase [Verrucomicrobiae bacterium]
MNEAVKLSSPATEEFWEIPILYEDDQLLALDKPSGLLISPDRYDPQRPNLMKLLHRDIERGAAWTRERHLTYLMNAHRLDFETSGVILLAKSKPALVELATQFGSEKPAKTYVALVRGSAEESSFSTDAPLAPHPARPGFVRVDPKSGKRSRTEFSVRETFGPRCLLLECRPLTGRTHQIRVHLRHLRLPLIGDEKYGGPPLLLSTLKDDYRLKPGQTERPLISRAALHAEQLIVRRPGSEENVKIEAPWPKDLTVAVKYLRRYAA